MKLQGCKTGPLCAECPLYEKGIAVDDRYDPMSYRGLSLVGQAPGSDEVRVSNRLVFTGPVGHHTDLLFKVQNYDPKALHCTNMIRCGLAGGAQPDEREVPEIIRCCKPLVEANLRAIGARTVVCMGAVALQGLTEYKGITKVRGCYLGSEPWHLTATYNPAAVIRRKAPQQNYEIIYHDLKKAIGLNDGTITRWVPDIRDASDIGELKELLRRCLREKPVLAVDVETTDDVKGRIDAYYARLETIGLSMRLDGEVQAWSIPWPDAHPGFHSRQDGMLIRRILRQILFHPLQTLVFHNKLFDVPVLERHFDDTLPGICEDTLLLHHAIYPKTSHTLQQVASQYLAVEPWKDNFREIENEHWWRQQQVYMDWEGAKDEEEEVSLQKRYWEAEDVRLAELMAYNASDTAATLEIYELMREEAIQDGVWDVYERDRRLSHCTLDWTSDGIGIDLPRRRALQEEYEERLTEKEARLRDLSTLEPLSQLEPRIREAEAETNAAHEKARRYQRAATLVEKGEATWRKGIDEYLAKTTAKLEGELDPDALDRLERGRDKALREQADISIAKLYMESHGDQAHAQLRCSMDVTRHKAAELRSKVLELRKTPTAETWNPNSGNHIRLIIARRGVVPTKVTKKSRDKEGRRLPSVSKDSLWSAQDDEFVSALFDWRDDFKLYSTYIKNLHRKLGDDKRLHPQYKIHSTPSGRFGMTPAANTWPDSMRSMMVAAPGCKIVGADYNALELRVVSLLSGEREWIDIFSREGDLHEQMAARYFPEEFPEVNRLWHAFEGTEPEKNKAFPRRKELRGRGKNITFGDIYLAGAETLYEQIRSKMPDVRTREDHARLRREVASMQRVLRAATPLRIQWAMLQEKIALETRCLRTIVWTDGSTGEEWGGRIRKWPVRPDPNECANHPIQGTAADIMNSSAFRLIKALRDRGIYRQGAWIILQVHDAWYLEVEEQYAEEVKEILEKAMYCEIEYTSPISGETNRMRFTAEAKIGDSVAEV